MKKKKHGFTLAEVLITLVVIGLVAAMTLPTLISRMHTKAMERKEEVFNQRLANGLREMAVKSTLMGYENSYEFAKELSKHYKVFGIYDTANIGNVYAVRNVIVNNNGDSLSISSIKKPKNIKLKDDETHVWANPVAILTTDGTPFIFSYNKKCALTESDINGIQDSKTKQSGDYTQITSCIAGVYDINGVKVPNKQNVDIISFNGGSLTDGCSGKFYNGKCVVFIGQNYNRLNCGSNGVNSPDYKYCASNWDYDYWSGALKTCRELGMDLPTLNQLSYISANRNALGITATGNFWSSVTPRHEGFNIETGALWHGAPPDQKFNVVCYED